MHCVECGRKAARYGRDRKGRQRFQCLPCDRTFFADTPKPIGDMRIEMEEATFALRLLLEGTSVRATERLTGLHRDTILDLVTTVGANCERLLEERIECVEVADVECDELWGFIGCKEKTRQRLGRDMEFGDCYCYVAIERHTKAVLAWHLGKRCSEETWTFALKLYRAVCGERFQISTDGFKPYQAAIPGVFRGGVDHGLIIKRFAGASDTEPERKYSPANVVAVTKARNSGDPDMERVGTSRSERLNLTLRMGIRRLTRLTNAHSKKLANHRAMMALYFAWYNYCRKNAAIKTTPAVAQRLTDHVWTIEELLTEAAKSKAAE